MSAAMNSIRPSEFQSPGAIDCSIETTLVRFDAGLTEMPARPFAVICMFLGPSVDISCIRSGRIRRGREVAGDLDIVPAETKCAWETRQSGSSLVMKPPTSLLRTVAAELDLNPAHVELTDRFQLRDPQIEHIGWALKADIEAGCPGGRLFRESLGTALAARLLQRHNVRSLPMRELKGGMNALQAQAAALAHRRQSGKRPVARGDRGGRGR